jgi:hypothetical protein
MISYIMHHSGNGKIPYHGTLVFHYMLASNMSFRLLMAIDGK